MRDTRCDLQTPVYSDARLIRESPHPIYSQHHAHPFQKSALPPQMPMGSFNIVFNYNDFSNRTPHTNIANQNLGVPVSSAQRQAYKPGENQPAGNVNLDVETCRNMFNIDQQKSNKATPRES